MNRYLNGSSKKAAPIMPDLLRGWLTGLTMGIALWVGNELTAGENQTPPATQPLTLSAALALSGASNTDVMLAAERSLEARARHAQARQQYIPWLTPGLFYRRTDGRVQDVRGEMIDVDKQSFGLALSLSAEVDLGKAIYDSLVTQRRIESAESQTEIARQQAHLDTRLQYIALVEAQAIWHNTTEAVAIAERLANQVREAVKAGLAGEIDAAASEAHVFRQRLLASQAQLATQSAAARLAETLRLPDGITLRASDAELQPMLFIDVNQPFEDVLTKALAQRPELRVLTAEQSAVEASLEQTKVAPLIPRLVLRGSTGGIGGGMDDYWGDFGDTTEIALGVEWRIGPGGMFDGARRDLYASQTRQLVVGRQRLEERIRREIQVALAQGQAAQPQITLAESAVKSCQNAVRLAQSRTEFGVAVVREILTTMQEQIDAQAVLIKALSDHNRAQATLLHAIGPRP